MQFANFLLLSKTLTKKDLVLMCAKNADTSYEPLYVYERWLVIVKSHQRDWLNLYHVVFEIVKLHTRFHCKIRQFSSLKIISAPCKSSVCAATKSHLESHVRVARYRRFNAAAVGRRCCLRCVRALFVTYSALASSVHMRLHCSSSLTSVSEPRHYSGEKRPRTWDMCIC